MGPEFQVTVQPEFSDGVWSMPFASPNGTAKCLYRVTYNLDHAGPWTLDCDNGRTASGKGRFFMRDNTSVSNGVGDDGAAVTVLSVLAPEKTS